MEERQEHKDVPVMACDGRGAKAFQRAWAEAVRAAKEQLIGRVDEDAVPPDGWVS